MTKPLPEAVALRAKIEADCGAWDAGTLDAAQDLLLELDVVRKRYWRETGGPARLAQCVDAFEAKYLAQSLPQQNNVCCEEQQVEAV